MKITARCDYACRAVLELARHWPKKGPLQISDIAKRQRIPMRYLVHILIQLKGLGIIESIRGKDGGYVLSIPPGKITLGRIITEMCGPVVTYNRKDELFSPIWTRVEEEIGKVVNSITFEDLVSKVKGGVYYI